MKKRALLTGVMALAFLLATADISRAADTVSTAPKIIERPAIAGYKKDSHGVAVVRAPDTIDTVIVHATYNPSLANDAQTFEGAAMLWKGYGVAPHYAIDPKGVIYRLIPENNIAFHAGVSALPNGDTDVNTRSIGIELIYPNTEPPSAAQYASLKYLLTDITSRYTIHYVLGHSQIAPGRKVDPWNFDWSIIPDIFVPTKLVFSNADPVGTMQTLTPEQQTVLKYYSYRKGCPVSLADMRMVTVPYYDFAGDAQSGVVITNKSAAKETVAFFKALFAKKFPLRSVQPVDAFQGLDTFSVLADNSSAFNCRPIAGTKTYSQHAYGMAIDINPAQNPSSGTMTASMQRAKGAVTPAIASALKAIGWQWGGDWKTKKDYQHFSRNGK